MTEEIILAGFSATGRASRRADHCVWRECERGKNVSWLPSYGPEMRGGTANCNVVVSDGEVGSPVKSWMRTAYS